MPFYVVGTAVFLYLASVGLWIDKQVRRSEAPICCATPTDFGIPYEAVQMISADGTALSGWYLPSQNGASVILLHGYDGHRALMLPQAAALAEAGYGVLLYDLRGHSESGGSQRTFGWADVADVETAVSYLQSRLDSDPNRIGIFGFSIGGQITLRAAAQIDALQAVVVDGPGFAAIDDIPPPQTTKDKVFHLASRLTFQGLAWRMGLEMETAVIDQIATISPRPILFIATGPPSGDEQRLAQHFYNHATSPKTIWTIPNAKHGTGMTTQPEAYKNQLIQIFDTALLGESWD
ncbi:MAG: alpha/beta fold hydrolase [Chloroflexi bacterium]|nr:MAG: alpha/beta fold hydrolase [Chloroflexota bacterium]